MSKYLQREAEPETLLLQSWAPEQSFDHCVVIPCYREARAFLQRLQSFLTQEHRTLCILVINRPDSVAACPENQRLIKKLKRDAPANWANGCASFHPVANSGILLIDRDQLPLERKLGVGQARKIGADLGCVLIANNVVANEWIHSTDADAHLPDDYFSALEHVQPNAAAATYRFTHLTNNDAVGKATKLYEQMLHHYVNGLAAAGSPYAFHTIGSAIAINHNAYMKARGFPKRAAGEDFYLLNKLAKLGPIAQLASTIKIEARASDRVPFGTGPATQKIMEQLASGTDVCSYHPQIFSHLRSWISGAEAALEKGAELAQAINSQPSSVAKTVVAMGAQELENHLRQYNESEQRRKQFHDWFDAFRTLKFIHSLEKLGYAKQPMQDCSEH